MRSLDAENGKEILRHPIGALGSEYFVEKYMEYFCSGYRIGYAV